MKKVCISLLAAAMMVASSATAFASDFSPADIPSGTISTLSEGQTRISPTTKSMNLTTTYQELYSDGNWTDIDVLLTNNDGNPGEIQAKIYGVSKSGQSKVLSTSGRIPVGGSWTSPTVANSYKKYIVKVRAVSKSGKYSITYDDIN